MVDFLRRWVKSEHAQAQAMLSAYVDGELTARDQQLVEGHLIHCDACVGDLHTLRYTKSLLAKAPMPRLPRSFVIRQVDLEDRPVAVPRRVFGLRPGLAYAYLRGATAVVAMAFALLVAGDFITQLAPGYRQPAMAPPEEIPEAGQEVAVEVSEAVIETIVVEDVVEKEAEEVAAPAAQASPTASPPARKAEPESVQSLAGPEETLMPAMTDEDLLPAKVAVTEEAAQACDESPTPTTGPFPTATTLLPTPLPTATPSPAIPPIIPEGVDDSSYGQKEGHRWPSAIRMTEIGLGGLALILLIATLVVRRQQS